MTTITRWIELDGAVNVRDLGGLPTRDGGMTAADRLIRADNLQGLTNTDVRLLVDEIKVRSVVDLRTAVEVAGEGPGPLTHEPLVDIRHLSLFPESGHNTDAAALDEDKPLILPWQTRGTVEEYGKRVRPGAAEVYLGFLTDRPDSVLSGLRLIARSAGATIVHCAAGKDRTGVVIALALEEVGVHREAIVEDYVLTGDRIEAIMARLLSSPTYASDATTMNLDKHRPRRETMRAVLGVIDSEYGGASAWLRAQGWTDEDAAALRRQLLSR